MLMCQPLAMGCITSGLALGSMDLMQDLLFKASGIKISSHVRSGSEHMVFSVAISECSSICLASIITMEWPRLESHRPTGGLSFIIAYAHHRTSSWTSNLS